MTDSASRDSNAGPSSRFRWVLPGLVLLAALGLRLYGVGFGLPALNDPDEPLFMMTAFDMVQRGSFNPQWFGHPATVTLYCLVLVLVGVVGAGIATGQYADTAAFAKAAYLDPSLAWLPARVMIVIFGVLCVWLVYRLGKRLAGERVGLLAALFLAVNAVHIEYSQVIRTDVQASVFMLLAALSALAIVREGRLRDYLLAGLFVGLACATKWPAALIGMSPGFAGLYRLFKGHREWRRLLLFGVASAVTLFAVSPFLLLDYQTVIENLSGEARPIHPGATGGGFVWNFGWYLANPLLASLGWGGLLLAALGIAWPGRGARDWLVAVLPGALVYFVAICAQALFWERWIVPLLPFAALAAARALSGLADLLRERTGRSWRGAEAVAALLLALPMLNAARIDAAERTNDTRQIASAWIRGHVPPRSTILIEHAGLDLLDGQWTFLFPMGSAGCVDAREALTGRIKYSEVEKHRTGRPVVDIGYVDADLLATCRADYAVISHYDRYLADRRNFAPEIARYDQALRGGRLRAVFRPVRGVSGGPVVRIVQLR